MVAQREGIEGATVIGIRGTSSTPL